jgi:autotransporter-associated beta strand protein
MKPNRRNPLFSNLFRSNTLTTAIVVSLGSSAVQAADVFWDRGSATNAWGTGGNWSPTNTAAASTGAVPGTGDVAVFNISALNTAQTIDLGANRTVAGLRFVSSGTVLLRGGGTNRVLTLGASGIAKTGTGAITIGSATSGQQVAVALGANQTWTNSAAGDLIALNVISGGFNLDLAGAGTFRFAGTNTYSGTTTIGAGTTLIAQNNAALGTTAGGTIISSGGTLNLGGTLGANTLNLGTEAISVSGAGVGGAGAIVNTGTNGQQNAVRVVSLTGDTTFGGTQRWDIRNGTLDGGGFNLTKVGTNSVFLSGSGQIGTALNSLTVQQGEFVMETGALATTGNITNGVLVQPTSAVTGAFRSWGNNVDHTANFTLDSSFAGSTAKLTVQNGVTTHSGTITAIGATNNLEVAGSQIMNVSGILAGGGVFNKTETGILLVNNAGNTHSGVFNLNAGILGGTGTLSSSALNIAAGATLAPGPAGIASAGTLSITNGIVSSDVNTAVFDIGTASDLLNVGGITQNGTTNVVVAPGPGFAAGTYTLINHGGSLAGTNGFAGFSLAANHIDGSLVNGPTSISLQLNSTAVPTWSGLSNGIWTVGSLNNPQLPNFAFAPAPGGQVEFVNNDAVLFDDSAVGTTNIITNGTVSPAATRFNNSSQNYSITGAISGVGTITKDGSGSVTLVNTPTTVGGLVINSGTLQLGTDSSSAGYTAGSISIATGSTLAISAGVGGTNSTIGVAGATTLSGGGTILLNSTQPDIYHNFTADRGDVRISSDLTGFTGDIVINDGNRLTVSAANSLGNASGITINNGGGLLVSAGAANYAGPITASGLGWKETAGALGAIRLQSGATLSGPINLAGDTRITAYSGSTGTLSGLISGAANLEFGLRQITNTSSGTLTVSNPANTYSGNTSITRANVNAATIADAGLASSLGTGSVINMEAGGIVVTGAGAMTTNRTININQGGAGGGNLGVSDPTAVVTYTGTINNGNANFPISTLDFSQTVSPAGTSGGTVVLNTTSPIRVSGSTIHRTNLTLAGNTQFTVDWPTTGTAAAPLGSGTPVGTGALSVGNNQNATNSGPVTLTIQDSATLTTYGQFDIGNANSGAVQTTTVNQTGGTVNALGGGLSMAANNRAMRIGHWSNNNATYNLSGGTLNVPNGPMAVGWDGTGTFNQSGGTANVAGLRFANSAATGVGTYNLSGGTLNVGALGMARAAGSATFNFDGGTYRATADHAISGNIVINLQGGGGTIDTNGFNVSSGSALLAGAAPGTLVKSGAGEFNLPAGDSTMTGTLNINGGSIGGAGTITAATVNVNSGGTLAGTLTVSSLGGVTVAGGGTLSPGVNGGRANGTLTVSSATLAVNSAIDITPASSGGDSLVVTGALTGTTIFNMLPVGSTPLAAGTYTLATAGATTGLTAALGAYPHLADGTSPLFAVNPTSVTVTTSAAADPMIWSGASGSNWDDTTANQWNGLSGLNNAAAYFDGDLVTFNGTSAVGSVIVQAGGVRPANVSIDSSSTAYTLSGGGIGGGASLTHVAGTTVLANDNSYLGTTTITAGTLQVGNGGTSGSLGLGATVNDGTLAFNRSDASIYAGAISGTGIVRSDGTGTTTLAGGSSYSGGTVISKGSLVGRQATSFGTGTITLNDASTGTDNTSLLVDPLNADGAVTVANNIVVSNNGTGTVSIGSSERSLNNTGTLFSGTLTLGKDVTMLGDFDRTTFLNVISGTADTITIARSPGLNAGLSGRVTWEGNNTFTPATAGVTTIQILEGAILQAGGGAAADQIPDTATVNVQAGGVFQLSTASDSETIGNLTGAGTVRNVTNTALTLTFGTADDTTFSGVINGGNSLSYTKQGSGTATWSGILDNPTGNITVNAGTIVLAKASTPTVHALGGNSFINSGGTLQLGGTFTDSRPEEDGRNNPNATPRDFPSNYVDQIYNDADLTVNAGGVFDLNGRSEAIDGLAGAGTVRNTVAATNSILYIGANNAGLTFSGSIEDGAGTVSLVKGGTGTQTLSSANTYSGITEIRAGLLTITNANALGSTSAGTLISGGRDGQNANLQLSLTGGTPAVPVDVAEPFTMISETANDQRSAIINLGASNTTRLTGNIVVQGDGISQLTASQTTAGDQFIINSNISGTASGTFFLRGNSEMQLNGVFNTPDLVIAKTDPGLLIWNSAGHDYNELSLVHGTVRTDVANAFDPAAGLRLGQNGNNNTLDLNGNSQTVAGIRLNIGATSVHARTVTSATPATFTINTPASGGSYNYAGNFAGALTLVKTGAGVQGLSTPLSGVNSYTGNTIVSAGSLRLGSSDVIPDGLGLGNVVVGDGATAASFDLNGYDETINGLNGNALGSVHSNGGHQGGIANSVLTVNGTATPAVDATFAGVLKDNTDGGTSTLALTKAGTGTQILTGINTYTGATNVNGGLLVVNSSLSGTSAVNVASGAAIGGSGTLNANTTISGIVAPGNSIGTLTVSNDVTWNGGDTASAATDWQFELGVGTADLLDIIGGGSEFLKGTGSNFRFDFLGTGGAEGTYTLVQWDSTADLGGGALGTNFQASDFSYVPLPLGYEGTFSFNGSSLQFIVVPEPSSLLLGGLGALALLRRRRTA